jgi:phage terminase large subunit GpA-like protein
MKKYYWTMKNGQKIDVDDMDITHLRNSLKMVIRAIEATNAKIAERNRLAKRQFSGGELMCEDADKAELYRISPELTCTCDEVHVCQQCSEEF